MADLKVCPFCESDKLKIDMKKKGTRYFGIGELENYTASVRCNVCHARGGAVSGFVRNRRFVDKDDWLKDEISIEELERRAIEKWNTRKPEESVVAKLQKLSKCGLRCDECINRERKDDCTDVCDRGAFAKAIEIVRNSGKE